MAIATFATLTLVQDANEVGVLNGGEAVRDGDAGAAFRRALQRPGHRLPQTH